IRNEALAAAEMGLGEYTYLYVLAYRDILYSRTEQDSLVRIRSRISSRAQQVVREMLSRQLVAAQAGEETAETNDELIQLLTTEIEILSTDQARVPWADGLPPIFAGSLAPYQEELTGLFCEDTQEFELVRNRKRAFGIQGD
ncbi:MAG: hypothetical protein ABIF77_04365, partial [bacterium]